MKDVIYFFVLICCCFMINNNSGFSQTQSDTSDSYWEVVLPIPASRDIDMGKCLVNNTKDSVVVDFVQNISSWKFRVDSIYFRGADASAFSLVSGFPIYIVEPSKTHYGEFRFQPKRIGIHQAEIVIITQSDTLIQRIRGEGVEERIAVDNAIIDFGIVDVGKEKDTIQVTTIKNTGSIPITITETRHSYPNDKDFMTISGGGSFTLQPQETKRMDLRFRPSDVGRTSGTLEFYYNGVGSPAVVHLFGQGIFTGIASAELKTIELSGKPGDIIKVPIILNKEENLSISSVNTIDVDLTFNPTLLYPKEYQIKRLDDKNAIINIKDLPTNKSIGEKLGEIEFTVGLGNQEECDLILSNAVANGGQADITLINGHFKLQGVCPEGGPRLINPYSKAGILSIAPNPADNTINLELSFIDYGYTEVAMYNTFGEKVKTIFLENITKSKILSLDADISDISNGVYFIILKSPTYSQSRIISILR